MPVGDGEGIDKGMCPRCGGDVRWQSWGGDCRGDPGGSGAKCLNCGETNLRWSFAADGRGTWAMKIR